MKKRSTFLSRLIALVIALVCVIGVFSGCSLVKTNMEKDGDLVVATVKLPDVDVEPTEIKKRDMYAAYVSYGYYYVSSYGYTMAQTYQMILDNLEQNAVVEQFAKSELAKLYNEKKNATDNSEFLKYFVANASVAKDATKTLSAKSPLDDFLTEYQLAEVKYNVIKSINDLTDSFVHDHDEEDAEEEKESVSLTARDNPFVEEEKEELGEWELIKEPITEKDLKICAKTLNLEINAEGKLLIDDNTSFSATKEDNSDLESNNMYKLNLAMFTNYKLDMASKDREKAFNEAINSYRNLGIISNSEFNPADKALEYDYFKKQLETEKAQAIVLFYQASLEDVVKEELKNSMLYQDYEDLYTTQEAKFANDYTAYETAMGEATDENPVVFHPFDGYGYVSNLLLGFSEEQTKELTLYKDRKGITKDKVTAFRNSLVNSLVVKDQRVSWATEGYGIYNKENGKYTFDDKYFLSDNGSLKDFIGYVENPIDVTEEDENGIEKNAWKVSNAVAESIPYLNFYDLYLKTGMGFDSNIANVTYNPETKTGFGTLTDYNDDAMRDLIYAFSTDQGSLKSKQGYLYSPKTSSTTYVPEFASAAKTIVANGENSYTLVVTDYGVHVMVCLDKISKTEQMIKEADFLACLDTNAVLTPEQEEIKEFVLNFKKAKQDSLVSSYVSEKANTFVSKYLEEGSDTYATTFYKDNYKNLI